MLSIQPGAAHPAGTASSGDQVAQLVASILADLPAVLSKEDASVARDPFAPLSTGGLPIECCTLNADLRATTSDVVFTEHCQAVQNFLASSEMLTCLYWQLVLLGNRHTCSLTSWN